MRLTHSMTILLILSVLFASGLTVNAQNTPDILLTPTLDPIEYNQPDSLTTTTRTQGTASTTTTRLLSPTWSPDGNSVTYTYNQTRHIVTLDGIQPATRYAINHEFLSWLPKSDGILASIPTRSGEQPLYVARYPEIEFSHLVSHVVNRAMLSPDETQLAYSNDQSTAQDGGDTIWIDDTTGTILQNLETPVPDSVRDIRWTSNGQILIVRTTELSQGIGGSITHRVWQYDRPVTGGEPVQQFEHVSYQPVELSADGQHVVYVDGTKTLSDALIVQNLESNNIVHLNLPDNRLVQQMSINHDGTAVAYTLYCTPENVSDVLLNGLLMPDALQQTKTAIFVWQPDNDSSVTTISGCEQNGTQMQPRISPQGNRLMYVTHRQNLWQLVLRDLVTNNEVRLAPSLQKSE